MQVEPTSLGGLYLVELDVHDDPDRVGGSFREVFQTEKMTAAGLPSFGPVQSNLAEWTAGTIVGVHAEPWEKFVHVAYGEAFVAIADLRADSPTAGQVWQATLDRRRALFVSRGLGNSYQALSDRVVYSYLTNAHWQPGIRYPAVAWDDPDLAIAWPIRDDRVQLSAKDRANASLAEVFGVSRSE